MPVNLTKIETSLSDEQIAAISLEPISSLYLHVPFCRAKCQYCDFYSLVSNTGRDMERFVDSVLVEAARWRQAQPSAAAPLKSIFMGGGTPTALPMSEMERLLRGLRSLRLAPDAEWSIEANPATIDREYCRMLLDGGVNRLSIGAQSFVDPELRMLGRIHDAAGIERTVRDAQSAGFQRISVDLMYAVPGQSLESWRASLERALSLGISHISCYCLTLEEGTPMWVKTQAGQLPAVDEDVQLQFMRFTRQWLNEHGLAPYEISNYAAPGEACRHNLVYWTSGNYVGIGPAAASHVAGRRWRNTPDLHRYLQQVGRDGRTPIVDVEELSAGQRATELLMLMLRLSSGLTWQRAREVVGVDLRHQLSASAERLAGMGLLNVSEDGISLTDRGCFVADEVIGELVLTVS